MMTYGLSKDITDGFSKFMDYGFSKLKVYGFSKLNTVWSAVFNILTSSSVALKGLPSPDKGRVVDAKLNSSSQKREL